MTDPIRIPIFADLRDNSRFAEVTTDLARQIVQLAYRESSPNDKLREIENKADAALHAVRLMKPTPVAADIGTFTMPDPQKRPPVTTPDFCAPVAADKPLPHDSRVVVTNPDAYRGAERPAHMDKRRFEKAPCYICGYNGPNYFQPATHRCAAEHQAVPQPAGDDAAVDHVSLGNAIICPSCDGRGEDCDEEGPTNQDCPRCHGHAWFYRHEYVADLRAKLAEAEKTIAHDRSYMKQTLLMTEPDADPHDNEIWGDLHCNVETIIGERDRLSQQLAELQGKLTENEESIRLYDEEARAARTKLKEVSNATLVECVPLDGGITNAFHVLRARIGELEGHLEGERCYSAQSRNERDRLAARVAELELRDGKASLQLGDHMRDITTLVGLLREVRAECPGHQGVVWMRIDKALAKEVAG